MVTGRVDNMRVNGQTARTARVASNSVVLFARIAFITVLNLFATRYVLLGLGKEDYGIYSAVGSFVLTASCLLPVLSLSIQRFFSYSLGKNDLTRFAEIFTASLNIILFIAVLIFIVFQTLGVLFLSDLNIPESRLMAAGWVFQLMLLSFLCNLCQVPFAAALFSHEDMNLYALISAVECLMKFLLALGIASCSMDRMVFYAAGWLGVSLCVLASYVLIARVSYSECRYKWRCRVQGLYREMLSFSGWTLYGALAGVGLIQGSSILLNLYFGPLMNTAFGIALSVYNAFVALANSIVLAFRPVMVKSYAEGRHDYLMFMFGLCNKLLLYLLLAVSLPIIAFTPFVLHIWLGEYISEMVLFCQLFIVFAVLLTLHNPITTIIQATGQIRKYSLMVESLTILNVPITWAAFQMGAPAYVVFFVMITLCFIAHLVRLYCLKEAMPLFSFSAYIQSLMPVFSSSEREGVKTLLYGFFKKRRAQG